MKKNKRYLVTGGSGFIGSALCHRLVAEGHFVRVLDNCYRSSASRLDRIASHIEFIEGDIRDFSTVKKAMEGIDSVIHLAAINGTENFYERPELVLEVGVKGMLNVLDACRACKVTDLVVASSSEAYQSPEQVPTDETVPLVVPDVLNPRYSYGGSKIISELLALNYGRHDFERVVIFRPHNVYGPDMAWEHVLPQLIIRAIKTIEKTPHGAIPFKIQGDGQQTRAFTHINDFIDGLMLVIDKGAHLNIYHIGNPEEITIAEVAAQVVSYFGRDITLETSPNLLGSTLRRCPDIRKLKALGFTPKIPFAQGLADIAKWYQENSHLAKDKESLK